LTESEFAELLQYLQVRMRSDGFSDVNDRIVADIRASEATPSVQLLRYLEDLTGEVRSRSLEASQRVLERFRSLAVTDNGEPVDGVILSVNEEDVLLFNTEQVSLVQGLELADVLEGLERLQSELRESSE